MARLNCKKILIFIVFASSITFFYHCFGLQVASATVRENTPMSQEEYQARIRAQNQYHQLLRSGDIAAKNGNYESAIQYYEQAFQIAKGSSLEAVSRGTLRDTYERMGRYSEALEQIEWFLTFSNPTSPLWPKYVETKARLLKKIEEQKRGKDPMVEEIKQEFPKASYVEQKQFLESLGGPGVWDQFKNAMVLEHSGKYREALAIYESLLPKREQIVSEMKTIDAWVMLYPGIQRTAELSGNPAKEKEALLWIKDHLLNSKGQYHLSLSKLEPSVIAHIQNRIKVVLNKSEAQ